MALLSDLVKAVADAEGIDQVSVQIFARAAREAKLISQKGRGRGAAHMSLRDSANLLIAVNGSPLAKEVSRLVPLFRDLEPTVRGGSFLGRNDEIGDALASATTFGDALEALLRLSRPGINGESVMDMCLRKDATHRVWAENRGIDPSAYVELEFGQPYIEASIKILNLKLDENRKQEMWTEAGVVIYTSYDEAPKRLRPADRQIRTSITQETLTRVAELELIDGNR